MSDIAARLSAAPGSWTHLVFSAVTGDIKKAAAIAQFEDLSGRNLLCLLAVANGQLDLLRSLEQYGCNLLELAPRLLTLAAAAGRTEVVEFLQQRGCDLQRDGDQALRAAVRKSRLAVLQLLHRNGCNLSSRQDEARALCLKPGNREIVDYLAAHGVHPAGPAVMDLLAAIRTGDAIEAGKKAAMLDLPPASDLIVQAVGERGDPGLAALLHQRGFDVRAKHDLALRAAAAQGHVELLKYLHGVGGDIHACAGEALLRAAEHGHTGIVRLLHERGACITDLDPGTLDLLRICGHTETFYYLTDSGLDASSEHRPAIMAIRDELYAARDIYRPSKLWEFFNEVNLEQLRSGGIHAFKRSINQNYFNFIPISLGDPQLRRLLRWWLAHPSLSACRLTVVDPDREPRTGRLLPPARRTFVLGRTLAAKIPVLGELILASGRRIQLGLYRWLIALLWDYVEAHDRTGLATRLGEPRLGSPLESYRNGRLVSQDLAHSILECNSILNEIGPQPDGQRLRIAEVGAGYGRLGYVLLHALPCQYVVFDIPPGLYMSQWYLGTLFPSKRLFRFRHFDSFAEIADELAQADIAFFSANQIELLPQGYFDLTINISSLHELRPDQIDNMLGQIYRITRRFVYLKQYKEYLNPYDGLKLLEDSYRLAPGWRHRYYRDDGVDARFFETLIESVAPPVVVAQAAGLPFAPARPTLSLLLANYNHAEYLHTALAGICGQTRPADEIIIVDDGSTDDSLAIIDDYAQRHPNIRVIRNGGNRGQHYSIQRALLAAKGEYVAWASSDDLLLPDFIERSLGVLEQFPEAGLCCSQLAVFVDGTTEVRHYTGRSHGAAFDYGSTPRHYPPKMLAATLRRHYLWMSGNTVVVRRNALLEMGGFEQALRWHSDWFAFYAVALRYGACFIPETLALMRERPDTYSSAGMHDGTAQSRVLAELFATIKSHKYRDLCATFHRCPSLLSPFGQRTLSVALQHPAHWDFVLPLTCWYGPRYAALKYRQLRQLFNRRAGPKWSGKLAALRYRFGVWRQQRRNKRGNGG